ncbi:MAG TPA: MFS transporter [Chloroflexota bacterium]|jgi:EmrB/QacA subfamily drug resistance transporter
MTTERENSSRYVFFTLASLTVLMSAIDATIVAVAIPQLTEALQAPLTWIGWTLTVYQLVQLLMMPLAGRLSDTLGRKRVFLFCTGAFTFGSLLCGLAPNVWFLIGFRALQAIGGGGLMPSAVGIVSDQFGRRRAQAIGLFTSIFPIGAIIGPNLGGYILHNWSWRELFFVNVPLGVIALVGVYFLLDDDRPAVERLQIDFKGIGLFAGALVALMYAMTALGDDAALITSPLLWGLAVASVALVVLFLRHIHDAAQPFVPYNLVARNPFLAANLYNFFYGVAAFGFSAFVPYYAVTKYGMDTFQSGAVLTPRAVAMIVVSALASVYVIKLGYRLPMVLGVVVNSLGLVLIGQGWTEATVGGVTLDGFWLLAALLAISGAGMGLGAPASSNAGIDLAPSEAAAITGLRGMFRQAGGVIGIAGVVLALSFYQDQGEGLAHIFVALAGIMLLTIPLAFLIPDTAWERRRARREVYEAVERAEGRAPAAAEPARAARSPLPAGARPIISGGADGGPAGEEQGPRAAIRYH